MAVWRRVPSPRNPSKHYWRSDDNSHDRRTDEKREITGTQRRPATAERDRPPPTYPNRLADIEPKSLSGTKSARKYVASPKRIDFADVARRDAPTVFEPLARRPAMPVTRVENHLEETQIARQSMLVRCIRTYRNDRSACETAAEGEKRKCQRDRHDAAFKDIFAHRLLGNARHEEPGQPHR